MWDFQSQAQFIVDQLDSLQHYAVTKWTEEKKNYFLLVNFCVWDFS